MASIEGCEPCCSRKWCPRRVEGGSRASMGPMEVAEQTSRTGAVALRAGEWGRSMSQADIVHEPAVGRTSF